MTDFLDSLSPVDRTHPTARACERYLISVKGVNDPQDRCLGFIEDEDDPAIRLYYYRVENGILEIQTTDTGYDVTRQVTDFITDPADIQEMLGDAAHTGRTSKIRPTGNVGVIFAPPR